MDTAAPTAQPTDDTAGLDRRIVRRRRARRVVAGACAVALLGVLAGCGDDDDSESSGSEETTATTEAEETTTTAAEELDEAAATAEIQAAMDGFLGNPEIDAKMANVQDGDKIADIVEKNLGAGEGNVTTTFGLQATFTSDTEADFTYDLQSSANPGVGLGLSQAGSAVLVDGTWLITGATICDLIGLGFPDDGAECLTRLG